MVLQYTTATSGTVTANDTGQDVQVIHEATAVTLTIAFPATPYNGQVFSVSTSGGITTLTMTSAVGSILSALTTMAAGGVCRYIYFTAQTKWYKI